MCSVATADPPFSIRITSSFVLPQKHHHQRVSPPTQVQQKMICFFLSFLVFLTGEAFGNELFVGQEVLTKEKKNEGTGASEVQQKGSADGDEVANIRFPPLADCGPRTRFLLLRRYASEGTKMHFGQQLYRKWQCSSCQYRRRCWCRLLLKTQSFEGLLARPEKRLARVRYTSSVLYLQFGQYMHTRGQSRVGVIRRKC